MDSESDSESGTQQCFKRLKKKTSCIEDSDSEEEQAEETEQVEEGSGEENEESGESEDGTSESEEGSSDEGEDEDGEDEDGSYIGSEEEGSASEWESNWESEEETATGNSSSTCSRSVTQAVAPHTGSQDVGFSSDESDGQSDKCPICLLSFTDQEVGTPESCDHNFCLDCILEWAKNVNTCPVDRQLFTLILVKQELQGKVVRNVPVPTRQVQEEVEDEDRTYCEVCGECSREDRLLLCDGCDLGYHLECLDPPLDVVPIEEWFCSDCTSVNGTGAAQASMDDDELRLLIEDAPDLNLPPLRPRPVGVRTRMVARTRQSERIRAVIGQNRRTRQAAAGGETELPSQQTTSGIESQSESSNSTRQRRPVAAPKPTRKRKRKATVRRKGTKRRRKTSKRKTTRKKTTASAAAKSKDGGTKKKVTGKRKYRRKVRRKKRKVRTRKAITVGFPKSVKARLAEQLNLRPPKPGHSLPQVKKSGSHSAESNFQRHNTGLPVLHLFGQRDELDYVLSGSEDADEVAVARPRSSSIPMSRQLARKKLLSASALRSHRPVTSFHQRQIPVPSDQDNKSATFDIIGGILDCQSVLLSKGSDVTLKQDGSVVKKTTNLAAARLNISASIETTRNQSTDSLGEQNGNIGERNSEISRVSQFSDRSQNPLRQAFSSAVRNRPLTPGQGNGPSYGNSQNASGGIGHSSGNSEYSPHRNSSGSWSQSDPRGSRAYASFLSGGGGSPNRDGMWEGREPSGLVLRSNEKDTGKKKVKEKKEEEDDDIDIYSDIEPGSESFDFENCGDPVVNLPVNSDSVDHCGMELEHASGNDADSDNELVIDDSIVPQEQNLPESEIYDPAEPSQDGDPDIYDPADPSHDSDDQEMVIDESQPPDTEEPGEADVDIRPTIPTDEQPVQHIEEEDMHATTVVTEVTDDSKTQETQELEESFSEETPDTQIENMNSESAVGVDTDHSTLPFPMTRVEQVPESQLHSLVGDYDSPSSDGLEEEDKVPAEPDTDTTEIEVAVPQEKPLPEEESTESSATVQSTETNSKGTGELPHKAGNLRTTELHLLRPGHLPVVGIHTLRSSQGLGLGQANYSVLYSPEELEPESDVPTGYGERNKAEQQTDSVSRGMVLESSQDHGDNDQVESEESTKKGRKKSLVSQIFGSDDDEDHKRADKAKKKKELMVDIFGSDDEMATTDAKSAKDERSGMRITGLEGLETETISEGEEMNFDDLGESEDNMEEGEIPIDKKKQEKRKSERARKRDLDILINPQRRVIEVSPPNKRAEGGGGDYEEGEIVEDRPKHKKDKKEKPKKSEKDKKGYEGDENLDITGNAETQKTPRKAKDASNKEILASSENKDNRVQKTDRRNVVERLELGTASVPWKKLSKTTKERNYRDRTKGEDIYMKEKEIKDKKDEVKEGKGKQKDRRKKEKRKELERYDVRKVVSERSKKEAEKKKTDEFGRDVSRSMTRERSRSRSRSGDRGRRGRSTSRSRYYRTSRGRSRSRSRSSSWSDSWTPSWSRSYTRSRSRSRSRDRYRTRSRSRGRYRSRSRTPSRSRGRYRSTSYSRDRRRRSRSRSRSRSKNRRVRSREKSRDRSIVWQDRSRDRRHLRSRDCSRDRERHKRVKEKDSSPGKKKEKKEKKKEKKELEKKKEIEKELQKKKKKKGRSPVLSKEVYASGDNIVVSVNFSKAKNKDHTQKDSKKKRELSVEHNKEPQPKKSKKDDKKDKMKDVYDKSPRTLLEKQSRVCEKVTQVSEKPARVPEKVTRVHEKSPHGLIEKATHEPAPASGNMEAAVPQKAKEKKLISIPIKKEKALPKFVLKKPPVIIDLDLSPVRFYEPSPTDVIVLSDSDPDDHWKIKGGKTGKENKAGKSKQLPGEKQKEVLQQVTPGAVTVSGPRTPLGPKTPPEPDNLAEPPIKFSIPMKKQLRAISNPLQEEDEESQSPIRRSPVRGPNTPPEPTPLEPDRQSDMIDGHGNGPRTPPSEKGPKTPPCEKGPKTPPLPGPTESDTYDPFDPTKSPTPSPPASATPASSSELEEIQNNTETVDGETEVGTVATASPIPPPEPQLPPLPDEPEPPEKPPEPDLPENGGQKTPSPVKQASPPPAQECKTATPVTPKTTVPSVRVPPPAIPATSTPIVSRPPLFSGLPANVASVLYSPVTRGLVQTPTNTTVFPQQAGTNMHGTSHVTVLMGSEMTQTSAGQIVTTQTTQKIVKPSLQPTQNGDSRQEDMTDVVDMDLDSPFSPASSEGSDLFEPPSDRPLSPHYPPDGVTTPEPKRPPREKARLTKIAAKPQTNQKAAKTAPKVGKGLDIFDSLFGGSPGGKNKLKPKGLKANEKMNKKFTKMAAATKLRATSGKREISIKMDEDQLKIMDELPSSAVEMQVKEKFLKKLNRQERVVEEVKLALKPYYNKKYVTKEEYKEILRRSVPKICHNRSGEINPIKIRRLVEGYVKKFSHGRKKKEGKPVGLKLKPLTVKL